MKRIKRLNSVFLLFYLSLIFSFSFDSFKIDFYLAKNSIISQEMNSLIEKNEEIDEIGVFPINNDESIIYISDIAKK